MSSSTTQEPRRSRRLRGGRPSYPGGEVVISASKAIAMEQIDNGEEVADDDLCPICQLLLYRPVTTECGHTMCEACMAHWAEVSVLQMPIVDVDEVPESFNAVTGLQAKCPMCRTQTPASLNVEMAQRLEKAYPLTWRERKVEDEVGEQGSVQTLTVYIGNRHRVITTGTKHKDGSSNSHEWTFFVRPSRTDIIKEVQILLHPTFKPSKVIRKKAPYEFEAEGWGFFTIVAHVVLKPGYRWVSSDAQDSPDGAAKGVLPLEWALDFDGFGGKGSMGRCRLKVSDDRG